MDNAVQLVSGRDRVGARSPLDVVPGDEFLPRLGRVLCDLLQRYPDAVLGVAGGLTTYRGLAELRKHVLAGRVSLERVRLVPVELVAKMDPSHSFAFRNMVTRFLQPDTDLPDANIAHLEDATLAPQDLATALAGHVAGLGGLTVALLGLGTNGHVATIEPAQSLPLETYVSTVTDETIAHAPPELKDCGRVLVTLGMGDLFAAQEIVVAASGSSKASAVAGLRRRHVDTRCPVSVLALHPGLLVVLDEAAYGT